MTIQHASLVCQLHVHYDLSCAYVAAYSAGKLPLSPFQQPHTLQLAEDYQVILLLAAMNTLHAQLVGSAALGHADRLEL